MFLGKRKNGYYFIQYTDPFDAKIRRKSTGTRSKGEANRILRNFTPGLPEKAKPSKLSDFRDEYLKYVSNNKSLHYIRSIDLSFRQLIEYCRDLPLEKLSARTLDQFITQRFSNSPAATLLYFRTLKAALSKAVVWGYINENPLKKIKPPKLTKSIPAFISKEDLQSILDKSKTRVLKELFTIGFYSGMRLGEIVNLVWDCVDFERRVIIVKNINGFTTKNKKERTIPMSSVLYKLLMDRFCQEKHVKNLEFVFYRVRGIKINENYVSKQFKKAVREIGLSERIHFHTLRHSFASNLVQRGASIYVVKELLGHESISTTQIYSHLQQKNLEVAIALLEN